jgi:hypothetical protein
MCAMPWLVGLDEYSALSSFEGMLLQDFLGLFSPYRFPRKSSASSHKCVGSPPQAAFGFHHALCCHCRSARSSHTYSVSSGRTPNLPQKTPEPRHAAICYCTAPSVPPEPHASWLHSPVHARLFRLFHRSWAGCFGNLLRRQRSVWGVQLVLILQLMLHMRWNPYIDTTLNKAPCPRSARKRALPPHPSAPSRPVRRERREERGRREGTGEERSGEERPEGHSTFGRFCLQVELGLSVASLVLAQCGMVLNPKPLPFSLSGLLAQAGLAASLR